MNKRTRFLVLAFGGLIALWIVSAVVYPRWVRPLLHIEDEITALRDKEDDATAFTRKYEAACKDYIKLVSRNGALQVAPFKGSLHRRLEALAHDHNLDDLKVTPKRETRYGKTECWVVGFSVSGQQRLVDVLGFLKDLYELPEVLQIVDPKLSPITPPRGEKAPDLVKLTLDVQALLLPPRPRPKLEFTVAKKDIQSQPDRAVRHRELDLTTLANRKPFLEYEPPVVAKAEPQKDHTTHTPREEPIKAKRWTGKWKVVAISQMHEPESVRVLVGESGSKTSSQKYVGVGQEIDGGILEAVNTRAVLVRRDDGIFVYGLGEEFGKAVKVDQAGRHPDLQMKAATLKPLTPEEIKALGTKSPMTLAAASSRGGNHTPPTINGRSTAPLNGSNSTSTRSGTSTTPGRLSSPTSRTTTSSTNGASRPPIPPPSSRAAPPSRSEPQPKAEPQPGEGETPPKAETPTQDPMTPPEDDGGDDGDDGDDSKDKPATPAPPDSN